MSDKTEEIEEYEEEIEPMDWSDYYGTLQPLTTVGGFYFGILSAT